MYGNAVCRDCFLGRQRDVWKLLQKAKKKTSKAGAAAPVKHGKWFLYPQTPQH